MSWTEKNKERLDLLKKMTWTEKNKESLDLLISMDKDILFDLVNQQKKLSDLILRYRVELACFERCREDIL